MEVKIKILVLSRSLISHCSISAAIQYKTFLRLFLKMPKFKTLLTVYGLKFVKIDLRPFKDFRDLSLTHLALLL